MEAREMIKRHLERRSMEEIRLKRWLRALAIAKCLFEEDGYFTDYLEEIEDFVKEGIEMKANLNISTLAELLESLPEDQKTVELFSKVKEAYALEVSRLIEFARQAEKPVVHLEPFRKQGRQFVSEFWVNDLAIPKQESYNFHGQNISQWRYAGCILVQDGEVTLHH